MVRISECDSDAADTDCVGDYSENVGYDLLEAYDGFHEPDDNVFDMGDVSVCAAGGVYHEDIP